MSTGFLQKFEHAIIIALIAITRKVIILDLKEYSGLAIVGIAVLIISIAVAYHFFKQPRKRLIDG